MFSSGLNAPEGADPGACGFPGWAGSAAPGLLETTAPAMAKLPTKPSLDALIFTPPPDVTEPGKSAVSSPRRLPIRAWVSRTTVFTPRETLEPDCSEPATEPATPIA